MDHKILIAVTLIISIFGVALALPSRRVCASYQTIEDDEQSDESSDYNNELDLEPFNKSVMPGRIECDVNVGSCYTVWSPKDNGSSVVIRQGCWPSDGECTNSDCVGRVRKSNSNTNFSYCCCTGHMCNQNFTLLPPEPPTPQLPLEIENWIDNYAPAIWICSSITIIIIICLTMLIICRSLSDKSESELAPLAPSGPGYSSNLQNVDNLKLCAMIGQGKYGTVWRGMVNEQPVAVKIFPGQYRQYFLNERDIYVTPLMESPSVLQYFGCDQRRTMDDHMEYLLVLSLAPLGCLQDWLVDNTTNFSTFYGMAKSLASGISHLHTACSKGNQNKPCICHRDLNSRNVLVKSDLTCCICDFGFALKTFGSRYEYKGEMTLAETKSINEVGTLRYMAPEILEGAVNLRDCETALKQIDVYALGLVLWELCTRCQDLYEEGQSPVQYKAPFEAETGKNPTFEQMQVLVSKHKARPLFPPGWGNGPAARVAQETCEDCWDHDSEARLTALCVEERLNEMAAYQRSISDINGTEDPPPHQPPTFFSSNINNQISENYLVFTPNSINLISAPPNQNITDGLSGKMCDLTDDTLLSYSQNDDLKNNKINIQNNKSYNSQNQCLNRNIAVINNINRGLSSDDNSKTKIIDKKFKGWHGVRALFNKRFFNSKPTLVVPGENNEKLIDEVVVVETMSNTTPTKRASLKLDSKSESSSVSPNSSRPSNLNIRYSFNDVTTSGEIKIDDFINEDVLNYKNLQNGQTYTLIKTPNNCVQGNGLVSSKSETKTLKNIDMLNERQFRRQKSLEVFHEVFNTRGSFERLRDPSQRVKTPGDVPASVRKVRASKTLSLYDDRMMDFSGGGTL